MSGTLRYNAVHWKVDAEPLRGCAICDYGRDLALDPPDHGRICRHPEVTPRTRPAVTDRTRARGGACGPEALFLTIKGVRL